MKTGKILGAIFLAIFLTASVTATYISLSTQISTENLILSNETEVAIKLTNGGDEIAYDVKVSLVLSEEFSSDVLFAGNLAPNAPYEGNIAVGIPENSLPGEYALGVFTDYKDANGYGFSSVSPTSLFIKERTISKIFGTMDKIEIAGEETKEMKLKIRNTDTKQQTVKIKLFLPRELKADLDETEIALNSKEEKEQTFKISSFGALPGSTYVVFAALEYDENSVHYSSLSSGVVKVVEKKESGFELPNMSIWIPAVVLVVLIIIFILYQFIGKNGKNEEREED